MNNGWIKLHRKLLDNPVVMKDPDYLSVWIYLLLNASHNGCEVMFGGKRLKLKPGEFTTGRKRIAEKLKISESKVQRILKRFETEQQIEQRTDRQCRLISILSWDEYQESEQRNEQQVNNDRTTSEQRVNTKQECKNEKKEKNDKKHTYGEMDNVKLTDDELEKLKKKFPYDYHKRIDDLSLYLASKGDKYKSHYSTILSWARKNNDVPRVVQTYKEPEREIKEEDKLTDEEFEQMMHTIRNAGNLF